LSISENEIFNIIKNIEKEKKLPDGLLTDIYDQELDREHLATRTSYKQADGVLRDTIMRYFENWNDN
tara:strand:+ start:7535 stop:7735 length:201 start_codon:yes stop_codon:yes gene_type:complete